MSTKGPSISHKEWPMGRSCIAIRIGLSDGCQGVLVSTVLVRYVPLNTFSSKVLSPLAYLETQVCLPEELSRESSSTPANQLHIRTVEFLSEPLEIVPPEYSVEWEAAETTRGPYLRNAKWTIDVSMSEDQYSRVEAACVRKLAVLYATLECVEPSSPMVPFWTGE